MCVTFCQYCCTNTQRKNAVGVGTPPTRRQPPPPLLRLTVLPTPLFYVYVQECVLRFWRCVVIFGVPPPQRGSSPAGWTTAPRASPRIRPAPPPPAPLGWPTRASSVHIHTARMSNLYLLFRWGFDCETGSTAVSELGVCPAQRARDPLLRGAIVNRTYGIHKNLHIETIFTDSIWSY